MHRAAVLRHPPCACTLTLTFVLRSVLTLIIQLARFQYCFKESMIVVTILDSQGMQKISWKGGVCVCYVHLLIFVANMAILQWNPSITDTIGE